MREQCRGQYLHQLSQSKVHEVKIFGVLAESHLVTPVHSVCVAASLLRSTNLVVASQRRFRFTISAVRRASNVPMKISTQAASRSAFPVWILPSQLPRELTSEKF